MLSSQNPQVHAPITAITASNFRVGHNPTTKQALAVNLVVARETGTTFASTPSVVAVATASAVATVVEIIAIEDKV